MSIQDSVLSSRQQPLSQLEGNSTMEVRTVLNSSSSNNRSNLDSSKNSNKSNNSSSRNNSNNSTRNSSSSGFSVQIPLTCRDLHD